MCHTVIKMIVHQHNTHATQSWHGMVISVHVQQTTHGNVHGHCRPHAEADRVVRALCCATRVCSLATASTCSIVHKQLCRQQIVKGTYTTIYATHVAFNIAVYTTTAAILDLASCSTTAAITSQAKVHLSCLWRASKLSNLLSFTNATLHAHAHNILANHRQRAKFNDCKLSSNKFIYFKSVPE